MNFSQKQFAVNDPGTGTESFSIFSTVAQLVDSNVLADGGAVEQIEFPASIRYNERYSQAQHRVSIRDWSRDPALTSTEKEFSGISGAILNLNLLEPSTVSFTLPGQHPDAALIEEWISEVVWRRNADVLYIGRLVKAVDELPPDPAAMKLSCESTDWRGLLDYMHIVGDSTTYVGSVTSATATTLTDTSANKNPAWTTNLWNQYRVRITSGTGAGQERVILSNTTTVLTVDPAWSITPTAGSGFTIEGETNGLTFEEDPLEDIVWAVLHHVQGQVGHDYGITRDYWPGLNGVPASGVVPFEVIFDDGESAWSAIKKVTQNADFYIDPVTREASLYVPGMGKSIGATLDYGGSVSSVRRTRDAFSNAVRFDGQDPVQSFVTAPNLATAPEGRWDVRLSDTTLPNQVMVDAAAQAAFKDLNSKNGTIDFTLDAGMWGGPEHIWLGDVVTVSCHEGRLQLTEELRVLNIQITLDGTGIEQVTITAGRAKQSALKGLVTRVQKLEQSR
ncbi:hypothetical protein ACIBSW_34615 [Actinoplanes sp. NPDC049668]|uniref:hypothetical protein n=1 Tax=unclassified Actinoplanes TaxID=2626549 RepID=UPI0033B2BBAC